MPRDVLKSIKTCDAVFSNGQDVIVGGRSLWIFRSTGEFVKKVLPVRWPCKAAFLPNRTALVESLADRAYYYLDLKTGEILWITQKKHRRKREPDRFAVSPDGSTIYNVFYSYHGETYSLYAERIIPEVRKHEIFVVNEPLNLTGPLSTIGDLFCDSDGTLCTLQYKNITRYSDYDYMETPRVIFHYGILALPFHDGQLHPYWKKHWQAERVGKESRIRACDGRCILYENLTVRDMESQSVFSLIDESDREFLPPCSFRYFYDPERFLLTIWRLDDRQKAVIDCRERKLVGRYFSSPETDTGYGGWVIGNEFWMGTPDGVVRSPFPNFPNTT